MATRKNNSNQSGGGSSCVSSYSYNKKTNKTTVRFRKGGSHSYQGKRPFDILNETKDKGNSLGRAFNKRIR